MHWCRGGKPMEYERHCVHLGKHLPVHTKDRRLNGHASSITIGFGRCSYVSNYVHGGIDIASETTSMLAEQALRHTGQAFADSKGVVDG
jgi:hypothetical protein